MAALTLQLVGVGILLSCKAGNAFCKVEVISDRVMTATFAANLQTTIIVIYSPTNVTTNDAEVEEFYNHLRRTIANALTHKLFIYFRRYEC